MIPEIEYSVNDAVLVIDSNQKGKIIEVFGDHQKQYKVETESGEIIDTVSKNLMKRAIVWRDRIDQIPR